MLRWIILERDEKEKRIEITKSWLKKFEDKRAALNYEIQAISSMIFTLNEDLKVLEETEIEDEK